MKLLQYMSHYYYAENNCVLSPFCLQIEYPWRLLINPVDTCIDALVIRGALQMSRFLSGEPVPAIAWLEQRQGEVSVRYVLQYTLSDLSCRLHSLSLLFLTSV